MTAASDEEVKSLRRQLVDSKCKLASLRAMGAKLESLAGLASAIAEVEKVLAFADARELMQTLGEQHPRTMAAVVKAVELADPGAMERMMAECGIAMPSATHVSEDGERLFSVESIAEAWGEPLGEVVERVEQLAEEGGFAVVTSAARIQ